VPKIISERCELVRLCHINRSGPVFWRHSEVAKHLMYSVHRQSYIYFCNRTRELKTVLGHVMPRWQHVCNGLARPARPPPLAVRTSRCWHGASGDSTGQTSRQQDTSKTLWLCCPAGYAEA